MSSGDSRLEGSNRPLRYTSAFLMAVAAILLRHFLMPVLGMGHEYVTVFPAIVVVAILAGPGPAIFTSIVGSLLAAEFFTPEGLDIRDLPATGLIVLTGFLTALMAQRLQQLLADSRIYARDLAQSESRYRTLFSSMDEGFCIAEVLFDDNRTAVDLRFVQVNAAFEKHTGLADARNKTWRQMAPGCLPQWFELYGKIALTGEPARFEREAKCLGRWMDVYVCPTGNPAERQVAIFLSDITQRRNYQEQLEKIKTQLENKNTELENIIGIVSHDLRAPLVNIKGFAGEMGKDCSVVKEALQKDAAGQEVLKTLAKVFDSFPDSIRFIVSSAEAIDNLAVSLVNLARAGLTAIKPEQLDMNAIIKKINASIELKLRQSGAAIYIDPLPPCFADKTQVIQVFTNLLDNAVKYLSPQRRGEIHIGGKIENERALYWICDNGISISDSDKTKIFEPYYQLHEKSAEGVGMGLATVKRMVDRNNGTIWLVSEKGKGTTFHIALPISSPT